ncbi:GNAT family N-acetyltransferase [Viscerimonas tarda]
MQIIRYTTGHKTVWDAFVRLSKNGTFLFCRDFMEYHSDRFVDYSLMCYDDKNRLIALLPGNISGDTLYSHQGLTYGGFVLPTEAKAEDVLALFSSLTEFLAENGIKKLVYKAVPHIYHHSPSEEDLYALFRHNAVLVSRLISSTIDLNVRLKYAQLRKRQLKKAIAEGLVIKEATGFGDFWNILEDNLLVRHQTKPVHSLTEISYLKSKFPAQIRLFTVLKDEKTIAGCLVFETGQVAHVQYISANEEGKQSGALDLLFDRLLNAVFPGKKYFDFGTSTEDAGRYLNAGLIAQKEGFGGRGVVYDTYLINID